MMRNFLLIILLCTCSVCLQAQIVKAVTISDCLNNKNRSGHRVERDRNESFDFEWIGTYPEYNLKFIHRDVLVNCANRKIDVKVKIASDTIFIQEREVIEEAQADCLCLKDLSFQLDVKSSNDYKFIVLSSDVSSISNQMFLISPHGGSYQITGKSNYQYQPFIMDGKCEWIGSTHYGFDGLKEIISNEDTVIQRKSYKKIFANICSEPAKKRYVGAIREENKTVFFVDGESETATENKIYDFTLKAGDQIDVLTDHDYTLNLEVAFIDTIQLENIFRRKYYFYNKSPYADDNHIYSHDTWIEGIGNEYEFTHPFPAIPTGRGLHTARLAGVWHNGKALFCDGYKCSCEEILPISYHYSTDDFHVLQNPIKDKLLSVALHDAVFTRMDIYSWDGKLLLTKEVSVQNGTMEIPLAGFSSGTYILILSRADNSRESTRIVVL